MRCHNLIAPAGQRSRMERRRAPRQGDRRGVLILVVLSLLILFVVIAVMFVIVASRARVVARVYSEFGRTGDTPQEIVNAVAFDLIRGSLNPHSPFRTTSILEDMYGHQSLRGMVTAAQPSVANPAGAGGLVDIFAVSRPSPRTPSTFSTVKDAHSGCLLTFFSGPAKGLSARILEFWPESQAGAGDARFRLFLVRNEYGYDQTDAVQPGLQFVINGRPFSGTGIGYNSGTGAQELGRVNATDADGRPYALLPNPAFFYPQTNPGYGNDPAGLGGANEDYDAPDFQNPFLAFYARPNIDPTDSTPPGPAALVKPSFHDPALLSFWAGQAGSLRDPRLVRQIFFRPNPIDHPIFHRAVNPALHARIAAQSPQFHLGPWDIDNDGDGVADSVWIDPGYPPQSTAQGRLYKRLAAILVLDLDGRLNVNAHGSLLENVPSGAIPGPNSSAGVLAGGGQVAGAPRGGGYGPAEIRVENVLPLSASFLLRERYGQDRYPGIQSTSDPFCALKHFAVPNVWPPTPPVSGFGTPADLRGRLAVALDPHGQPVWDKLPDEMGRSWDNELTDNPYELDLSRYSSRGLSTAPGGRAPFDNAFSVGGAEKGSELFNRCAAWFSSLCAMPRPLRPIEDCPGLPLPVEFTHSSPAVASDQSRYQPARRVPSAGRSAYCFALALLTNSLR